MTDPGHPLVPFETGAHLGPFRLEVWLEWAAGSVRSLHVRYLLQGPLEQLMLPSPNGTPRRRDELWQGTCFEAFLAVAGSPHYWEMNLSPSGDWNLYRLAGYRQRLLPELACERLPFTVRSTTDSLELEVCLSLGPMIEDGERLEVALAAVIQHSSGCLSHWALHHPAAQADFHHRGGFLLTP